MKFKVKLPPLLEKPEIPANISKNSKWLSGEGAGSWFEFVAIDSKTSTINRYDPNGELECSEVFKMPDNFDVTFSFAVTYPSFCNKVTVIQNSIKIALLKSN